MWRYQAVLPVDPAKRVSLGEGFTPLLPIDWKGHRIHVKPEWFNPTSSFKDRGVSVMISHLAGQGAGHVLEDSSGNGGSSVAAYSAAAGIKATIIVPEATSAAKILQARAFGAEVDWWRAPATRSPTRPSGARPRSPTPATTGTPCSCRAPRPSATRCGSSSGSAHRTTWSSSPAPAATSWAATWRSPSSSRPVGSTTCHGCWWPSPNTGRRSPTRSTASTRPPVGPAAPPSRRVRRSPTRYDSLRPSRRSAGPTAPRSPSARTGSPPRSATWPRAASTPNPPAPSPPRRSSTTSATGPSARTTPPCSS